MCLPIKCRTNRRTRRRQETRRLRRKAQKALTQMQFPRVMIPRIPISILLSLRRIRSIVFIWADRKLRRDLIQRVLGVWKTELLAEESGLGGIAVRGRDVETEGWVYEGLGGLDEGAETEHGSCNLLGAQEPARWGWILRR